MEVTFPDSEKAVFDVVDGLDAQRYLRLTENFLDDLPAIHIYQVGGSQVGIFRADRLAVDVLAAGRDEARTLASQVNAKLTAGPHDTAHGTLDLVEVEVAPHGVPHPSVSAQSAVYRIHTRPL